MSIHTIGHGIENRERVTRTLADHVLENRRNLRLENVGDRFETQNLRARGLDRLADNQIGTNGDRGTNNNSHIVSDLIDTTRVELDGAQDSLAQSVESDPPTNPSLPDGELTVNEDGSITTPGGYTIFNDGGHQWRIKDPSGIETKIFGDPHVDEGNDGTIDWHFNKDGTFILPDGTKIFCDTDQVRDGVTVSNTLKIQYKDFLGTMDTANGGAGTVEATGGLDFDSKNKDGELYVMGNDGRFYDGETLGKLYDAGGDFARDVDANNLGHISENALISLKAGLLEEGLELKNDDPVGPVDGEDGDGHTDEDLAALLALEDNAWIVDDTDGEVAAAAAARRRIEAGHILGQANQADEGFDTLKALDKNGDGVVSGAELDGIKVWIDANNDGNADETEIKLLAEFQVDQLKVKMEVGQDEDGTQRLDGQFERDGNITRTNDRITVDNDAAQGRNFTRQLHNMIGDDRVQRAAAHRTIDRALERLDILNHDNEVQRTNNALRTDAHRQARQVQTGGARV